MKLILAISTSILVGLVGQSLASELDECLMSAVGAIEVEMEPKLAYWAGVVAEAKPDLWSKGPNALFEDQTISLDGIVGKSLATDELMDLRDQCSSLLSNIKREIIDIECSDPKRPKQELDEEGAEDELIFYVHETADKYMDSFDGKLAKAMQTCFILLK